VSSLSHAEVTPARSSRSERIAASLFIRPVRSTPFPSDNFHPPPPPPRNTGTEILDRSTRHSPNKSSDYLLGPGSSFPRASSRRGAPEEFLIHPTASEAKGETGLQAAGETTLPPRPICEIARRDVAPRSPLSGDRLPPFPFASSSTSRPPARTLARPSVRPSLDFNVEQKRIRGAEEAERMR